VAGRGKHSKDSTEFIYGEYTGYGPCVLRAATAEMIASTAEDLRVSPTVRDLIKRYRSKPGVYDAEQIDEIKRLVKDNPLTLDNVIEPEALPGDGYFPSDVRTAMLDDLPAEVFEAGIGTVRDEMGGILLYEITDADVPRIIDVLESLGHTVRLDQPTFDRMAGP
jgi:hypothetical protein